MSTADAVPGGDDAGLRFVRIPRQAWHTFATAMRVGVMTQAAGSDGLDWHWAPGSSPDQRVEVAFPDSGDAVGEAWLRLSSDRVGTLVRWTAEEWDDFVRRIGARDA